MAKNFGIRIATENDIPIILSLIRELAVYEKLEHELIATEELMRQSLFCEKPAAEVLIAEYEDTPVGYALFFHNFSTFLGKKGLYLEDLFIKPHYRGKGFGKALLLHVVRLAKERNCGRVEWSVLNWNQPAIDFYKSLGAVPMDGWTVYRLDEEVIKKVENQKETQE